MSASKKNEQKNKTGKPPVAKKRKDTPNIFNRKVLGDFDILDKLQAGLMLTGTEVKSIRLGRGQLGEGFVKINKQNEAYLYGVTIPQYEFGNRYNHDPTRIRKLLLSRKELNKWRARAERETLTIVPLRLYFRGSWAKLEIALAKRKLKHDKRRELKDKAIEREVSREIKIQNR